MAVVFRLHKGKANDMLWKYAAIDNVTSVAAEQIVHVYIKGDWLLNWNARQITSELHNAGKITKWFVIFIENYA